jgi:hypothetical protein
MLGIFLLPSLERQKWWGRIFSGIQISLFEYLFAFVQASILIIWSGWLTN